MEVATLYDVNGRFNPKFVEGREKIIEADSIVIAIGQKPELDFISPHHGIELTNFGTIKVDQSSLSTSVKNVMSFESANIIAFSCFVSRIFITCENCLYF